MQGMVQIVDHSRPKLRMLRRSAARTDRL